MPFTIPNYFSRWLTIAGALATCSAPAMTPEDLAARLAGNERLLLVDVRPASAYAEGHIPGAINIPLSLLPDKQVPSSLRIVLYGDGLGVVDDAKALAIARAKQGVAAEVLDGGYAAWLSATRLSTELPGVGREKVPGITYQQLVSAGKTDMVLLDLRAPPAPATAAAGATKGRPATAAQSVDVLADFAQKIGVPIVSANSPVALAAALAPRAAMSTAAGPPRAAAQADSGSISNKLVVLVADNDAEANAAARRLRASGHYRFTVLIGGTEIIRHEGRQGTGRMDGSSPPVYRP